MIFNKQTSLLFTSISLLLTGPLSGDTHATSRNKDATVIPIERPAERDPFQNSAYALEIIKTNYTLTGKECSERTTLSFYNNTASLSQSTPIIEGG